MRQSPQQKKRLSLKKDRRNTFGESPHAARKSIPKYKRFRSREERRAFKVPLVAVDGDALAVDLAISRAAKKRKGGWRKLPDQALGVVLGWKVERREQLQRCPRKGASRKS